MDLNLELKEFTIDRSKWRCGGDSNSKLGEGYTQLLNKKGYMCCLGQIAAQMGFDKESIKNIGEPADIDGLNEIIADEFLLARVADYHHLDDENHLYYNSDFAAELIRINDDNTIDTTERERRIIEAAAKHNVTIKFQ